MRILYLCGVLLLAVSVMPSSAYAVRIFLDPVALTIPGGDTVYVPVRIDTQGDCINAARVELAYDPAIISVQDISVGDSIFSLWTVAPTVNREGTREIGTVTLEGGIPGGYCGRVEGDPGLTNSIARLVVRAVPGSVPASTTILSSIRVLPDTQVILHDGQGTLAPVTVLGADLVLEPGTQSAENTWLADIRADTIAPEFFDIILVEGPSVGNNRHYIVFSTTDKQSGVDHYEVLETDPDRFGFLTWVPRESHWVRTDSPYVLRDQKLLSKILVKAIDKAGNERTVEYTPPRSMFQEITHPLIVGTLLFVCLLIGGIVVWVRRRNRGTAVGGNTSIG